MSRPVILALHGVGSGAGDLAAALAPLEPVADIVALNGFEPFSGGGQGRQWFSIAGVTEANRPSRVADAMPRLMTALDMIAAERDIERDAIVLLGFSQGAIMTLAAVAGGVQRGRAIAIAGRLAAPVVAVDHAASLLLLHDRDDPIMPITLSVDAGAALDRAGHRVEGAWSTGVGHSIGKSTLASIADWLAVSKTDPFHAPLQQGY